MCEKAPCSVCPNGVPKRELNKHTLALAACLVFLSFCLRLYLFALYLQQPIGITGARTAFARHHFNASQASHI